MFLLDSDHISVLWYSGGDDYKALMENIDTRSASECFVSIVTFEEQMRGWLAYVSKSTSADGVVKGYANLQSVISQFSQSQVASFDDAAADVFTDLKKQRIRIGTMDLRIASIAIASDFTLLTRNTVDFERVPNLRFEDWTRTK